MKKLILALLSLLCISHLQAQNVEGQIIAAQYGEYKVPGQSTGGFTFPSDTCQVTGGGKNFSAFATGVAVKIVDANPALTEIDTPSSVFITQCTINMATTYNHVPPYYLTSGTGGLQEAITANQQGIAGPNSIILNAEWYNLIQPRSASTVIASAQGNTNMPLVDITTTPYTWYQWGGSAYAAVSVGGGGTPCLGIAAWSSLTNYFATQFACSGGVLYTATANSTNHQPSSVSAFWTPTVFAGGTLGGGVILGGQFFSGGSLSAEGAPVPAFVSDSGNSMDYEQQQGTDIFQWGAQNDGSTQNYWSLFLNNTAGSTARPHNFTVNWASNSVGHDEWHGALDNFICWASGDSATACSVGLSLDSNGTTVDVGTSQGDHSKNLHVNNLTLDGSCTGCAAGSAVGGALSGSLPNPQLAQKIVYADNVNGAGVGVSPVAWVTATHYPWCQAVTNSGSSYIEVAQAGDSVTTPGTNSAIWYPVGNTNTPTQLDCAFYTAASSIVTGTGTVTAGAGASLIMGSGSYTTNIGLLEPTVGTSGNPVVNIFGQGKSNTIILLGTTLSVPVIEQPPSLTGFAFASFVWNGFTVNANFTAPAAMGIYGAQQFTQSDLYLLNAAPGSDHLIEWGNPSDHTHSWVYEQDLERIDLGRTVGSGTGAVATAAVSGGTLTFTIVSGGSGYTSANTNVILGGTSDFGRACSSVGTTTPTFTGTAISGITSTATGCVAPVYPIIFSGTQVAYGYKFSDVSDRGKIDGLTDGGVGSTAGMYIGSAVNAITINNYHPISTLKGVENHGGVTFNSLQCDTMYQYCFDNEAGAGTVNLNFPFYEWSTQLLPGSRDIYLAAISGVPGFSEPAAFNVTGEACGNSATFAGYAHFDSSAGVIDTTTGSDSSTLPVYVNDLNPQYCNNISTSTPAAIPTVLNQNFSIGNGGFGNQWNFNVGTNRLGNGGAGSQKLTISQANSTATASLGIFEWDFSNTNPATSSNNYSSPLIGDLGAYWDGSVTQPLGVKHQLSIASGTGPLATYAFTHSGTVPAGGLVYSFDEQIKSLVTTGTAPFIVASTTQVANLQAATAGNLAGTPALPSGTTATTQAAGDNTTDLATDAFVQATTSVSLPLWGTDTGTGAAYVVTTTPTLASLVTGAQVCFIPANNSSTSAPTLAVDGLTAKTIVQGATASLTGVPIQTVSPACFMYSGTNWVLENSLQVDARSFRSVQGPASAATGCILNASSSSQYQCTPDRVAVANCGGTASSSSTLQMAPGYALACNTPIATGNAGIGWLAPAAGTVSNLNVRCTTTGFNTSSGIFTIYHTASGTNPTSRSATTVTVTYGTTAANTTVSDTTHSATYAAGDLLQVLYTTQATETLTGCSVSFNY